MRFFRLNSSPSSNTHTNTLPLKHLVRKYDFRCLALVAIVFCQPSVAGSRSSSMVSSSFPAAPSSAGAFRSPCTATPSVPHSCPSEQEEVRSHSMRQKLAPLFLLPTSQVPSSPRPQRCSSEIATWRPQITSSTVSLRTQPFDFGRSGCSTPPLSICYAAPPHRSRAGDGSSAGKGRGGASLPAWKRARELGQEEGTDWNTQSPAPEPPAGGPQSEPVHPSNMKDRPAFLAPKSTATSPTPSSPTTPERDNPPHTPSPPPPLQAPPRRPLITAEQLQADLNLDFKEGGGAHQDTLKR